MEMGIDRIGEAILQKVQQEAQGIIEEAEAKARQELEKARRQSEATTEQEKRKLKDQAKIDGARILAQASIKAREEVLKAKSDVVDRVIRTVRDDLGRAASTEKALAVLLRESIDALGSGTVRVQVAKKDRETLDRILKTDSTLSGRVIEVKEAALLGGVIAEDPDGTMRIDNSYETRLEILLPRILPEVSRELF